MVDDTLGANPAWDYFPEVFEYVCKKLKKTTNSNDVTCVQISEQGFDVNSERQTEKDYEETLDSQIEDQTTEVHVNQPDVLQPTGHEIDSNDTEFTAVQYPYTEWIKNAKEATPDIVESFGLEEDFWAMNSQKRAEWGKTFSKSSRHDYFGAKFTALHIAAYFGYAPLASQLLQLETHSIELHTGDSYGDQPLFWACLNGNFSLERMFCEKGADLRGGRAGALIHAAAFSRNTEIVGYLLKQGVEIDAVDDYGFRPLAIAANKGYLPMVQFFLDQGAVSDAVETDGKNTPLNMAAGSGDIEIVRLIISGMAGPELDLEYNTSHAL